MSFPDLSPAALRAVAVLSDQWHLSILLCLYASPRRFNQLREDLPRISPRALSLKLKNLQEAGYVTKRCPDQNRNFCEYSLSVEGARLKPILRSFLRLR